MRCWRAACGPPATPSDEAGATGRRCAALRQAMGALGFRWLEMVRICPGLPPRHVDAWRALAPFARAACGPSPCSADVKRWKDGQMVLRWVASALADATTRMRRLRGCAQMKSLLKALDAKAAELNDPLARKAA